MEPVRVLIVDDSAFMRSVLTDILSSDPGVEVLGTAPDVSIARRKIKELNPDVITLDVELPGMDGLSFLEKIMRLRPTPVVMISGHTQDDSEMAFRALEIGAIDVVGKASINLDTSLAEKSDEILTKVKAAASANVLGLRAPMASAPRFVQADRLSSNAVIAIGASAGGVEAMRHVVAALPAECPPILYTQHMPREFLSRFSARLNQLAALEVCEAEDKMEILPGHLYLAPGNAHLRLRRDRAGYRCDVGGDEPVSGHCPSVDVLFESVADAAGADAVGAILTGMGKDGAAGLLAMRSNGAFTLGQDEATSLIYGMPRVAYELGAVELQVSLRDMAIEILKACSRRTRPRAS